MKKVKRTSKVKRLRASTILRLKKNAKKRKYSKKYLLLRNSVLLRDHYQCQMCQATGVKLEVHHVIKWSSQKIVRQNKRNLISLCKDCHRSIRNKEERYVGIFKRKIARNTLRAQKEKLTYEEIVRRRKEQDGLTGKEIAYQKKDLSELERKKKGEHYLRTTWRSMKNRTSNPNSTSYKRYGGRGIRMCNEWHAHFSKFKSYVLENLGERPEGCSIDRIDNDGNYEPGNIRWASPTTQRQNNSAVVFDQAMAEVAFILYHKYRKKQIEIVRFFKLNNPTAVRNIIWANAWVNVTHKYKSIVKNKAIIENIEEWKKKNEQKDSSY